MRAMDEPAFGDVSGGDKNSEKDDGGIRNQREQNLSGRRASERLSEVNRHSLSRTRFLEHICWQFQGAECAFQGLRVNVVDRHILFKPEFTFNERES